MALLEIVPCHFSPFRPFGSVNLVQKSDALTRRFLFISIDSKSRNGDSMLGNIAFLIELTEKLADLFLTHARYEDMGGSVWGVGGVGGGVGGRRGGGECGEENASCVWTGDQKGISRRKNCCTLFSFTAHYIWRKAIWHEEIWNEKYKWFC